MLQSIAEMLATPEGQSGWYEWASVGLAHVALGAILCCLAGVGFSAVNLLWRAIRGHQLIQSPARAALYLISSAWITWEGAQLAMVAAPARDWGDAVVDLTFEIGGAVLAFALWTQRARTAAIVALVVGAITYKGVVNRRRSRR